MLFSNRPSFFAVLHMRSSMSCPPLVMCPFIHSSSFLLCFLSFFFFLLFSGAKQASAPDAPGPLELALVIDGSTLCHVLPSASDVEKLSHVNLNQTAPELLRLSRVVPSDTKKPAQFDMSTGGCHLHICIHTHFVCKQLVHFPGSDCCFLARVFLVSLLVMSLQPLVAGRPLSLT